MLILLLWSCQVDPPSVQTTPADLCVVATGLFDGTGAPTRTDRLLVVQDGLLEDELDAAELDRFDCAETVEGWVIPGFFDMHTHITLNEAQPSFVKWSSGYDEALSDWALRSLLAHGVTTGRDVAGITEAVVAQRDAVRAGDKPGPELFVTGAMIEGASAWFAGDMSTAVSTPEEARAAVQAQAAAGVDGIKILASAPPEVTTAAIDEAHQHDLFAVAHLGRTSWLEAIDAGVDGTVHFVPIADDAIEDPDSPEATDTLNALVAAGVGNDPTLYVYAMAHPDADGMVDPDVLARVPAAQLDSWERGLDFFGAYNAQQVASGEYDQTVADSQRWAQRLHEAGAHVMVGTDFAMPYVVAGHAFHQELLALAEAGIPNDAVLVYATRHGAEWLGIDDRTGTVEVGKEADLVVLGADPVLDLSHVSDLRAVLSDGVLHDPDALLAGP